MRAPAIGLVALLSLACTPGTTTTTDPVQPSAPSPTTIAPEDPGTKGPRTLELHPIALREGSTVLAQAGGHGYVLIDGEPIPLEPGVAPSRDPKLGRGIAPREAMFGPMFSVVDFAGRIDEGQGYLVVREDFERAGSDYHAYQLGPRGWSARPDTRHGALTEMFHALVTTADGAVLGLRGWVLSSNSLEYEYTDDTEESERYWNQVQEDRKTAPTGFALLSGSTAVIPTLPAGSIVSDAISTSTGQIIALARQVDSERHESLPERLLEWAPGQASPTVIPLPELGDDRSSGGSEFRLWPAGERAIVAGLASEGEDGEPFGPYLAVGGGGSWSRVAIELPEAEGWDSNKITSAALTDDGEMWVTTGAWPQAGTKPQSTLWRQSGGQWRAVELPAVDELLAAVDGQERWGYDLLQQTWIAAPAGTPERLYPAATGVAFVEGELWVTAELGPAFATSSELYTDDRRTVLFSSRAIDTPVWLTSFDRMHLERVDRTVRERSPKLGDSGCQRFTIVVLDQADAGSAAVEQLGSKLAAAPELPTIDGASANELYLGAPLDAPERTQLVYSAYANSPREAKALVEHVGKRSGVSAHADCRPRALVRMYSSL